MLEFWQLSTYQKKYSLSRIVKMKSVIFNTSLFFLLYFITDTRGQFCQGIGSSYSDVQNAVEYPIEVGKWFLNLQFPSSCSGQVIQYDVRFFLSSNDDFTAYVALWEIADIEASYHMVDSSILRVSTENMNRRKRTSTDAFLVVVPNNLYARKGSVIGVYFEANETPLSVIGQVTSSSSSYSVCRKEGTKISTVPINCTLNMVPNLIIFAQAHIDPIQCYEQDIVSISNGYYILIDGDTQYGATVKYICDVGYEIINGDNFLQCNKNGVWFGNVPMCGVIHCEVLEVPSNVIVQRSNGGNAVGSVLTFTCYQGDKLIGSLSITCLVTGIWSGSVPTCVLISTTETTQSSTTTTTSTSEAFPTKLSSISMLSEDSFSNVRSTDVKFISVVSPSVDYEQNTTNQLLVASTTSNLHSLVAPPMITPMQTRSNGQDKISTLLIATSVLSAVISILSAVVIFIICTIIIIKRRHGRGKETHLKRDGRSISQTRFINSIKKQEKTVVNPVYGEPLNYEQMVPIRDPDGYFQLEPSSVASSARQFHASPQPYIYPSPAVYIQDTYDTWSSNQGQGQQYELCVPNNKQRRLMDQEERIYEQLYDRQHISSGCSTDEGFFTEESIYWEPESDTSSIYEQLAKRKYREIPRQFIRITDHLGSGQFGTVDRGIWIASSGPINVAIKTLKGFATEEEEIKFLQEAAINGQFHHPNVVKLSGVVTIGYPTMIILEFIQNGDLKHFLEQKRPMPGELADESLARMLISFSHQIACGMVYLSEKKFIHRDLAARNILVSSGDICKIADFGMSRDLKNEAYYRSNATKIPVKWTAPEALQFRKYSTASDVWSFGVVLYEIWSVGYRPFHKCTNQESMRLIDSGYRLPAPPGCPRSIYELMIICWNPSSPNRPSFSYLVSELSKTDFLFSQADQLKSYLGTDIDRPGYLYSDLQNQYNQYVCDR